MLVFIDGNPDIIKSATKGRPFFSTDVKICEDPDAADFIFTYLGRGTPRLKRSKLFRKYERKYVIYGNYDRPNFAYKTQAIKFLAQPLHVPAKNKEHRIIPCPLTMGGIEYQITRNREFIKKCRSVRKSIDFIFMGSNQDIGARRFLKDLKLKNFVRVETGKIWRLPAAEKIRRIKRFLLKTAEARYCFAPRGMGSSSYRLYQSLMVGTVPIVSGMKDYPFPEATWKSFCVIDDKHQANYGALLDGRHAKMRQIGMKFWDDYVFIPRCYQRLVSLLSKYRA
jgi:hypothetical protein